MPDKGMAVRFSLIDFAGLRKLEHRSSPSEKTASPKQLSNFGSAASTDIGAWP